MTVVPHPLVVTRPVQEGRRADPAPVVGWLSWALAAAFALLFAAVSLLRYRYFVATSWDLSIFTQAVSGYAHLAAPIATVRGPGFNVLGDHFSPIIAVLAPFYRLVPDPQTLLVAQAVLFGLSVQPIAKLAMARLGRARGIVLAVAYGVSWGLSAAIAVDFHEIAFAVPLLAFALCALVREHWWAATAWAVPLVLTKEDLGLTVAAIGLVMVTRGAHRIGAGLTLFGLAATAVEIKVLIPWIGGSYAYASKLQAPGTDGLRTELFTLLLVLGITGFLALRSPLALVAVPTLAWRFLSDNPYFWGQQWHYSAVLMPIMFVALLDGLVTTSTSRYRWVRDYAAQAPAVVATVAVMLLPQSALWSTLDGDALQPPAQVAAAEQALLRVPDGVSVETDIGLMSHLVGSRQVYWIGDTGALAPDYLVIDSQALSSPDELTAYAQELHPSADYALVYSAEGYAVLRRAG